MDSSGNIIWHDKSSIATIAGSIAFKQILVDGNKVDDSYYLDCDRVTKTVSIRADVLGNAPGDMLYYHFMRAGITDIGDTAAYSRWTGLPSQLIN